MRLWSIHPRYLDAKSLTACRREGLLARKALAGQTRGQTRHPQSERIRAMPDPENAVDAYLHGILRGAARRGYRFDAEKPGPENPALRMEITRGQPSREWEHLRQKLRGRQPGVQKRLAAIRFPEPHPLFVIKEGGTESWERMKK